MQHRVPMQQVPCLNPRQVKSLCDKSEFTMDIQHGTRSQGQYVTSECSKVPWLDLGFLGSTVLQLNLQPQPVILNTFLDVITSTDPGIRTDSHTFSNKPLITGSRSIKLHHKGWTSVLCKEFLTKTNFRNQNLYTFWKTSTKMLVFFLLQGCIYFLLFLHKQY